MNCPRRARHGASFFLLPRSDVVAVARRASHFRVAGPERRKWGEQECLTWDSSMSR